MSEETRTMQTADTTPARAPEDAPALVKKIGKTTYKVRVHFSNTSTETMSDKIKRMLKNEIQADVTADKASRPCVKLMMVHTKTLAKEDMKMLYTEKEKNEIERVPQSV